jgi:hypothetical protein
MRELRGLVKFLVAVLAPILLVLGGAGLAALGVSTGWYVLLWTGLIIAGIGLIWGIVFLLLHGPTDLLG